MKYIKKFENINKKFWIINPLQPYLKLALKKIGMNNKHVEEWYDLLKTTPGKQLIFFDDKFWTFSGINSTDLEGKKYIENPDYENMGEVFITEEEAMSDKYNL